MSKIKSVSVSGVDGSGKSTLSTILYKYAIDNRLPVVKIWFRFPYFFTYILLLFARILGLTKTYRHGSRTYTIHFFERIKHQYKILLIIDFILNYITRIITRKIIGVLIIFDREGLDALIDYYVDTSDRINNKSLIYRVFMREHLLSGQITVIADAPTQLIVHRRPELIHDPKFLLRIAYYRIITRILKRQKRRITVINTVYPLEKNIPILLKIVDEITRSFQPLGYGKKFRNPYIKAMFMNKYIILLTNWTLQGSFIASPIENIIRFSIDLTAFILPLILLNNILIALAAVVLAHTINYLLNSNAAHTRRFFHKYNDISERLEKTIEYIKRNINRYEGVDRVVIFGSSIREELGEHSDIDLRIVYRRGLKNIMSAYIFMVKLRVFALKNNIPLDAFLTSEDKMFRDISLEERSVYTPITITGRVEGRKKK